VENETVLKINNSLIVA